MWNDDSVVPAPTRTSPGWPRDCRLVDHESCICSLISKDHTVLKSGSQPLHLASLWSRHLRARMHLWLHQGGEGTGKTHFWRWVKAWETPAPPCRQTMGWPGSRDITLGGDHARDNANHPILHLDTFSWGRFCLWALGEKKGCWWLHLETHGTYLSRYFQKWNKVNQKGELWVTHERLLGGEDCPCIEDRGGLGLPAFLYFSC